MKIWDSVYTYIHSACRYWKDATKIIILKVCFLPTLYYNYNVKFIFVKFKRLITIFWKLKSYWNLSKISHQLLLFRTNIFWTIFAQILLLKTLSTKGGRGVAQWSEYSFFNTNVRGLSPGKEKCLCLFFILAWVWA